MIADRSIMRSIMRFALVLGAAIAMPGTARAAGAELVGTSDLVALLDGNQARIFLADGRPLIRLPPARGQAGHAPADPGQRMQERREQIFELFDVPIELRDSQEADDLLEEELTLSERSAAAGVVDASAAAQTEARAAADRSGLWLAVAGGLYRVDPAIGSARIGPLPRSTRALAAGDHGTIVIATDTELLSSTDGGKSFRGYMRLGRPPSHLAIDPAMAWLAWADGAGVHLISRRGERSSLARPVRDLRACGGQLVALAEDGLYLWTEGGARRISGPVPGGRLICRREGAGPWLVVRDGLLMSVDQGRTFRARADAPAGVILSAAFARDRIWLFSLAAGLTSIPFDEQVRPSAAAPSASVESFAETGGPRWASFLLPRLTFAASYARSTRRRSLQALAVAEVPLGGPDPRPVAQPSAPTYPAPYVTPYPPRDPDAHCLAAARLRAVARAQAEPERARSLVARAGRAAWLPELRLRGEKRLGRSESLDLRASGASGARDALGLDASDDVRYEVRATWDLPRLVFSPEEVAAVQQALRMADMRREIEAQVNRIYFERRRLLVNPAGAPPVEATGALLRVEELEGELDSLSAGEFSRCRGSGPYPPGP
jgi:hypothetical protein